MQYIKKDILKKIYKNRPKEVHKYDFGYLLIIGGSKLYTGSPALVAMAAMRAGVDLTLVVAPKRVADIVASFSPNLIAYSLEGGDLERKHLPEIFSLNESAKKVSHGKTAFVIGGGLGRDDSAEKSVIEYLSNIDIPGVIDADAIWAVAKDKNILKGKPFILTPHSYEFYVFSGKKILNLNLREKIKVVEKTAKEFNVTILLKGEIDIISDGEKTVLNSTGCPEMSVGGTGDTLAGICGALLAQGVKPLEAASVGAFVNGKAGELARKKYGVSLLATDIIEEIPNVI